MPYFQDSIGNPQPFTEKEIAFIILEKANKTSLKGKKKKSVKMVEKINLKLNSDISKPSRNNHDATEKITLEELSTISPK